MKKNYNLLSVISNFFILFILISNYSFSQISTPLNTRLIEPSQTIGLFGRTFVKHLHSANDEMFYTLVVNEDGSNYFGQTVNKGNRLLSRLASNGMPKWTVKFIGDINVNTKKLNSSSKYISNSDLEDNFYFLADISSNSTFVDSDNLVTNISFNSLYDSQKVLVKVDKDGHLIWYKIIDSSSSGAFAVDRNNDVFVLTNGGYQVDDYKLGANNIIKLNGINGNVNYVKYFNSANGLLSVFQMIPAFDAQNNFYLFLEPMNSGGLDYNFDSIVIRSNENNSDNLMLKFDSNGNVIFGKNFYADASVMAYSWVNDVAFDGTDFIIMGNLMSTRSLNFYLGLDNVQFPKNYSSYSYSGLFAKISTNGNIIWQKPIESSDLRAYYTNIDLDENKNIYSYLYFKGKVLFENNEYNFDSSIGNKVITKLDNAGNLIYLKNVDTYHDVFSGTNYSDYYKSIDVFGIDKFNCTGFTAQNIFLNYSLINTSLAKTYIATFGNLDSKYLSPLKNYLSLSNLSISNNPNNDNTFSFDLINNVNWTAESDQSWLNLGFQKLSQRTNFSTLINGTGDSKITMTAETNNTGLSRTANVLVTGDSGVASSTIIVTQTGTLGTQDYKTFVITLYPNPTSEVLNIQSQEKISRAEIYDFTGKLLLQTTVIDKKINVSALAKGTYFIKLHTEKGIVNSKFIKN